MTRTGRCFALVTLVAAALGVGRPARVPARADQTFRIQTDLVVLQAGVYDDRERAVTELTSGDFLVYEDDVPQTIRFFISEDRPVAVGLVIDNSTSMWDKRAEVIAAADAFARSSNAADALFTVNFNERVSFGLPPDTPFTSDRDVLHDALTHIQARGRTALYDAVNAALEHVATSPLDARVLIVVSDGGDNGSRSGIDAVLTNAQRRSAVIYTVGLVDEFSTSAEKRTLERLADATGGLAMFPRRLGDVRGTLEQIARDVRHRYTLGYAPSNTAHDGSYRRIRVVASRPGAHHPLHVKTRPGYVAPDRLPGA